MIRFLVAFLLLFGYNEAGVYPNYRANYDFISWDKNFNVEDLAAQAKWWETASFYQIYPRSFKDSDGDGVGDLKGITQQLDYLKEMEITATWLSPIFKSPFADFGYDIANFTEIDPIFGNLDDLHQLIKKANKLGLKIILDFVPNHSSDESEWFIKSAAKDPFYKDFYVWHPGKIINGVRHPPSNWVSVFRGPAWTWNDVRQEYYLHQFLKKQPDLNYRNPKVREAMRDVLRYWLKQGVSGFRVDAVPSVFEVAPDANGNWPDEPRNEAVNDPEDYGYLQHIYTLDQPETIDMVYEWRKVLDDFQKENGGDERVLLAECYSPLEVEMKYYGNDTVNGAQIPFNFLIVKSITNVSNAYHYVDTINSWLDSMPEGRIANWVIGNHDQSRVGSRLGTDRIDMMNILIKTLPGVSVTYQGEEIGMTNVWISWEDTVDPSACNSNPNMYELVTRDPERTPFQWDDTTDAGFSAAKKTWLPISPLYKEVNVAKEQAPPLSHLNIYKQLQLLRKTNTFKFGGTKVKALNEAVIGIERSLLHDYTFVTVINIFDNVENINLHTAFGDLPHELEYVLVTDKSTAKIGDKVQSNSVRLNPKEAVVLRSTTKLTTSVGYFTYYQPNEHMPNAV